MGTILNQAKETLRTYKQVKEDAKKMYTMYDKDGNPDIVDILASENVRDDAGIAIGEIKVLKKALKNSSKKEQYEMKQQEMELIREEAKNNCRKKQYCKEK